MTEESDERRCLVADDDTGRNVEAGSQESSRNSETGAAGIRAQHCNMPGRPSRVIMGNGDEGMGCVTKNNTTRKRTSAT